MRSLVTRSAPWRLGLAALLLALAMRLLVPTGFMWDAGADGSPQLVPCSGMAPVPAAPSGHAASSMHHMAMAGNDHHQRDHQSGDNNSRECAFAGLGGPLDLADPFVAPAALPLLTVALPVLAAQTLLPGRGLAAPPPPSRGPPVTF
ncbi:hypothetical protein HL653_07105 [Sphingomonas sp. AP4-R1]|uniref:hypothetical protein n=1 Tax=Sphingomonas sp. AP4-R1 TaxID=2735134 RepID=UPI001493A98C|nr:hypothetical protein [Sphingomonas sp. AP4-R1]QJU57585.1 hypothetical protein HL653_07105 [Sphingomonas sp. AP4-R1]